jgi:hypothetical protein
MQFYIDPGSQFMLRGLDFWCNRVQYFALLPRHGNHNEFKWSQFRNKELLWSNFPWYSPSPECDETISVLLIKVGIRS